MNLPSSTVKPAGRRHTAII